MKQLKVNDSYDGHLRLSLKKDNVTGDSIIFIDVLENGIESTHVISTRDKVQKLLNWLNEASMKMR